MTDLEATLQVKEITHYNGEPCKLIPCAECENDDHELCECDMLRCEQCDKWFCHDHAFSDRDGNGSFCHDCGYGWLTYRQTVEVTDEVKRLREALHEIGSKPHRAEEVTMRMGFR